jgi:hypothetical protein
LATARLTSIETSPDLISVLAGEPSKAAKQWVEERFEKPNVRDRVLSNLKGATAHYYSSLTSAYSAVLLIDELKGSHADMTLDELQQLLALGGINVDTYKGFVSLLIREKDNPVLKAVGSDFSLIEQHAKELGC